MGLDINDTSKSDEEGIGLTSPIPDNLIKVEELIDMAMGDPERNRVNFKVLRNILYLLSREMNLLNQKVEIVDDRDSSQPVVRKRLTRPKISIDRETIKNLVKEGVINDDDLLYQYYEDITEDDTNKVSIKSSRGILNADIEEVDEEPKVQVHKIDKTIPTYRRKRPIEVVTMEQYRSLKEHVDRLEMVTAPIPLPSWPDNEKLKADIIKGTASLTDTMQAMNISSRVEAAETAVDKLVELITVLAANGSIPTYFADKAKLIKSGITFKESVTIHEEKVEEVKPEPVPPEDFLLGEVVTEEEMNYALSELRNDLLHHLRDATIDTSTRARTALKTSKHTAEDMEKFLVVSGRMNKLQNFVHEHTQVLKSFKENRDTQIQAIKEQMGQLMSEVKLGVEQIAIFQNDSQDYAIQELKLRMSKVIATYDEIVHKESQLFNYQDQLFMQLKKLQDEVQQIRQVKADRDEVQDGLRDKADLTSLKGVLTEKQHNEALLDLFDQLAKCHDQFDKQDSVWQQILEDFREETDRKAPNIEVMQMRDDIQAELQNMLEKVQRLERYLSDPKALLMSRQLEKDARCGICREPTRVDHRHVIALAGMCKVELPALCQRSGVSQDGMQTCVTSYGRAKKEHKRIHACRRWVGGSHTIIPNGASHYERVEHLTAERPMPTYYGTGSDGKSYLMERQLAPCAECNVNAGGDATELADAERDVEVSVGDNSFNKRLPGGDCS